MISRSAACRGHAAVVAGGSQGGDPCLSVPIAIFVWEPITARGAPVRVEAVPAAGAEAMAFKALVHLARGQIKANWAHQGLHVYFGRERHVLSLAVQWGVAIEIERAIKKSARFC